MSVRLTHEKEEDSVGFRTISASSAFSFPIASGSRFLGFLVLGLLLLPIRKRRNLRRSEYDSLWPLVVSFYSLSCLSGVVSVGLGLLARLFVCILLLREYLGAPKASVQDEIRQPNEDVTSDRERVPIEYYAFNRGRDVCDVCGRRTELYRGSLRLTMRRASFRETRPRSHI